MRFVRPVMLVVVAAGCAGRSYVYRPTTQVTATQNGQPASRYAVPPESPRGEVLLSTAGVTMLDVAPDRREPFVHVRMTIANNNAGNAWRVDPGRQLLSLGGQPGVQPRYASTEPRPPGILEVGPGQKAVVDLFFPASPARPKEVPAFDLLWSVDVGTRVVSERTPFERLELEPAPSPMYAGPGWGGYFWGHPYWHAHMHPWWWDRPYYGAPYVIVNPRRSVVPPPRSIVAPPARATPAPGR